jgi:hypothetical protein
MGFEENPEPTMLMEQVKLKSYINDPHQRFIYVHDFIEMWTLNIELLSILPEQNGVEYPHLYKSQGEAPKQNAGAGKFKLLEDTELDDMADEIIKLKKSLIPEIPDLGLDFELNLDLDETELDDEEEDEDNDDSFGPAYGEDLDENEIP